MRTDAQRSRLRRRTLALLLGILVVGTIASVGYADVILTYHGSASVSGTTSPFEFVNGGNYATANGQGFSVNTYPNAQQASVATSVSGADGAYGTYVLDTLEVASTVTTSATWSVSVAVSTPLVATGVNAAYVFYCTAAPTGVSLTGTPLASGTDANGNPWAIYAPTCPGSQTSLSLLASGSGTPLSLTGLTSGTSVLYFSFAVAVTNTGATTTTAASITLEATSG
jgi:hypothetical protein